MATQLRALIVEDSEDDALMVARELNRDGFNVTFERVDTPQSMSAALDRGVWDIVISDHNMPYFSAPAALRLLRDSELDLPFIIVSGAIGEDAAVAAMRAGANDYIIKGNLARLNAAVEREMRDAEIRREHRKTEEEERRLHRQLEAKQLELQNRLNQITALNRLFQEHLMQRSEVVEAYDELIDVLQRHMQDTKVLVDRAHSQPISQLRGQPKEEGGGVISPTKSGSDVDLKLSLQPAAEKSPFVSQGSITAGRQQEPIEQRIRVLIADGDERVRQSIHGKLEQAEGITVAGETGVCEEGIEQISSP